MFKFPFTTLSTSYSHSDTYAKSDWYKVFCNAPKNRMSGHEYIERRFSSSWFDKDEEG